MPVRKFHVRPIAAAAQNGAQKRLITCFACLGWGFWQKIVLCSKPFFLCSKLVHKKSGFLCSKLAAQKFLLLHKNHYFLRVEANLPRGIFYFLSRAIMIFWNVYASEEAFWGLLIFFLNGYFWVADTLVFVQQSVVQRLFFVSRTFLFCAAVVLRLWGYAFCCTKTKSWQKWSSRSSIFVQRFVQRLQSV